MDLSKYKTKIKNREPNAVIVIIYFQCFADKHARRSLAREIQQMALNRNINSSIVVNHYGERQLIKLDVPSNAPNLSFNLLMQDLNLDFVF